MEAIDEETENNIDRQSKLKNYFKYKTNSGAIITDTNTYLYGEINLNNKKDIDYLMKFRKIILNPYDTGNWYYTSFDYKTGIITRNEKRGTFLGINFVSDVIKWFKFNHCLIGKPKRIIIYKLPLNTILDDGR